MGGRGWVGGRGWYKVVGVGIRGVGVGIRGCGWDKGLELGGG